MEKEETRVGFKTTSELEKIAESEVLDALESKDWSRYVSAISKYNELINYNRPKTTPKIEDGPSGAKYSKRASHWLMDHGGMF